MLKVSWKSFSSMKTNIKKNIKSVKNLVKMLKLLHPFSNFSWFFYYVFLFRVFKFVFLPISMKICEYCDVFYDLSTDTFFNDFFRNILTIFLRFSMPFLIFFYLFNEGFTDLYKNLRSLNIFYRFYNTWIFKKLFENG